MAPAQDSFPEQDSAQESPEQTRSEPQAASPAQAIWFLAAPLFTRPAQAVRPLQVTVHELPAQLIEPAHDLDPAHVTSQPVACPQSIPPAQPFGPQVIRQGMRDGHVTMDPQAPAALQSTTQVPST
jgi:hypothetical protein